MAGCTLTSKLPRLKRRRNLPRNKIGQRRDREGTEKVTRGTSLTNPPTKPDERQPAKGTPCWLLTFAPLATGTGISVGCSLFLFSLSAVCGLSSLLAILCWWTLIKCILAGRSYGLGCTAASTSGAPDFTGQQKLLVLETSRIWFDHFFYNALRVLLRR